MGMGGVAPENLLPLWMEYCAFSLAELQPYFTRYRLPAQFIGHPEAFLAPVEVSRRPLSASGKKNVLLLPGSRRSELDLIFAQHGRGGTDPKSRQSKQNTVYSAGGTKMAPAYRKHGCWRALD